jgi:hypothetical protein
MRTTVGDEISQHSWAPASQTSLNKFTTNRIGMQARHYGLCLIVSGGRCPRPLLVAPNESSVSTRLETAYVPLLSEKAFNLLQHVVTFRAEFNLPPVDGAPVRTQIAENNPRVFHREGWSVFR